MKRTNAEAIITPLLEPIYGFCLRRCKNLQDAEDLSQEIALKAYLALTAREDILSPEKYIWSLAHNALNHYYRSGQAWGCGIPLETVPSEEAEALSGLLKSETNLQLHREIARLSRLQRQIVTAYYFDGKKQEAIAAELSLPLGTVKWHLFEAKKELRKGMNTMRQTLTFDPIHFELCGTNGCVGTKGSNQNFFRSILAQNIAYAVYDSPKTVLELADLLGVSPVYVESEAEFLEEYGFLLRQGQKLLPNLLIETSTPELTALHDQMYRKAAELFAPELYRALSASPLLRSESLICAQKADKNYLMWSLIPYVTALSEVPGADYPISFEEVATLRPDGGKNICYAVVQDPNAAPPRYFDSMRRWCGPLWNVREGHLLWQIESEWSSQRVSDSYHEDAMEDLHLLLHLDQPRSQEEYARLIQRGYFAPGTRDFTRERLQLLWINDRETSQALLEIGSGLKAVCAQELEQLKKPYAEAMLEATPKHLKKVRAYGLQHIFHSDGWFILHCIKLLLEQKLLTPPEESQKRSVTTILVPTE